jgi:hypothetical protein
MMETMANLLWLLWVRVNPSQSALAFVGAGETLANLI